MYLQSSAEELTILHAKIECGGFFLKPDLLFKHEVNYTLKKQTLLVLLDNSDVN